MVEVKKNAHLTRSDPLPSPSSFYILQAKHWTGYCITYANVKYTQGYVIIQETGSNAAVLRKFRGMT